MVNYRYSCKLCDFEATQAHIVKHLIRHHPSSFTDLDICIKKANHPISNTNIIMEGYTKYTIYACMACMKFYNSFDKCQTHIINHKCSTLHSEKCNELLKSIDEDVCNIEIPKNIIVDTTIQEDLQKQIDELKKQNELQSQLLKEQQSIIYDLQNSIESDKDEDDIEDLKDTIDYLRLYQYRYERLRFHLLLGTKRNKNGKIVPWLSQEKRVRLINALESDTLLPRHKDGEDNWYDDFKYDDYTVDEYDFPIKYEVDERSEDDD